MNRQKEQERFESDDYSPYGGPDFQERNFELGEIDSGRQKVLDRLRLGQAEDYFKTFNSDEKIYEEVETTLKSHPVVDARGIKISVSRGVVTLKGVVPVRAMKLEAEDCIEFLVGVRDVQNEIRVKRDLVV